MPQYSEQWNRRVAYKAQGAGGTEASGASGTVLRTAGGQGGRLSKNSIESQEVRQDGLSTRGRHGSRRTAGSYQGELSLGALDDVLAAVMRGAWGTADLTITQVQMTSVTTGANTIIAAAGSWITQGIKVHDVIRATGLPDAANNGKNLRVTGVTALIITVAETLVVNASADTTFSIVRPGRVLINPAAGALVKPYFTIDEYEIGIDASEVFWDCVWGNAGFSIAPDGLVNWQAGWMGPGKFHSETGGTAPWLTTPSQTTAVPMAATEMVLRLGTGDMIDLTGCEITLDNQPAAPSVIGIYAPDVFLGSLQVGLNITALRSDLLKLADFVAETPTSAHILICENESEPRDFMSIAIPNFTLGSVDKSPMAKAGGATSQTIAVPPALVGIDERGGAYDLTMIKFQRSNA